MSTFSKYKSRLITVDYLTVTSKEVAFLEWFKDVFSSKLIFSKKEATLKWGEPYLGYNYFFDNSEKDYAFLGSRETGDSGLETIATIPGPLADAFIEDVLQKQEIQAGVTTNHFCLSGAKSLL